MPGQAEQIDAPCIDVHFDPPSSLCGISMKKDPLGAAQFGNFSQRLKNTDLIVRRHNGDKQNSIVQFLLKSFEVKQPILVDRKNSCV